MCWKVGKWRLTIETNKKWFEKVFSKLGWKLLKFEETPTSINATFYAPDYYKMKPRSLKVDEKGKSVTITVV